MGSEENVKNLEDCSVSNALGTWVFSVAGALLAIPVGIKRKSLAPLVFFGTTGTMLDIIMGITACEREHAERQMKLLEEQNLATDSAILESTRTILVTQALDGNNYTTWSRAMQTALSAKNKIGFVNGELKAPASDSPNVSYWTRCNDMVKSWILNSVSRDISNSVIYAVTAANIWTDLRERFAVSNIPRIFQLRREIALCLQESVSVTIYFTKLKTYWDELFSLVDTPACTCGSAKAFIKYQQQEYVMQFLMGLHDSYSNIRGQILLMDPLPNLNKAYSLILQEEQQRALVGYTSSSMEVAALAASTNQHISPHDTRIPYKQQGNDGRNNSKQQGNKRRPVCEHCNWVGHVKAKCYVLHGYPPGHRLHQPSTTSTSSGSKSNGINSLTADQIDKLLNLIKDGNPQPFANFAGPTKEDEDWSG